MGYYMEQADAQFHIPAEHYESALRALKALDPEVDGGQGFSSANGVVRAHFAWCDMAGLQQANTLKDALRAMRWDALEQPDAGPGIQHIEFLGQKLGGDEVVILGAIAPFVKDGSYIEMRGEDDTRWRWVFRGGRVVEVEGRLVWDDDLAQCR